MLEWLVCPWFTPQSTVHLISSSPGVAAVIMPSPIKAQLQAALTELGNKPVWCNSRHGNSPIESKTETALVSSQSALAARTFVNSAGTQ